jgi:predicted Zn finger-like uncharacterized protein
VIQDDLEPLITRCPNCGTRFRVTESQLAVAAGRVRCGACLTVFEGTEHLLFGEEMVPREENAGAALDELLDELADSGAGLPGEESDDAARHATGSAVASELDVTPQIYGGFEEDEAPGSGGPETGEAVDREKAGGTGSEHVAVDDGTSTEPAEDWDWALDGAGEWLGDGAPENRDQTGDEIAAAAEEPEVALAEVEASAADAQPWDEAASDRDEAEGASPVEISFAPEPRRWWVGLVAGLFGLALIFQVFYFQLPSWSRDPGLRPIYETACSWLGCELPAMRDISRMSARNLVVRSHPDLDNALIVDAVIVNGADYAQPFPDLELRFTAVGGLLVAGRRFRPDEYLNGDDVDVTNMPPNTPVQVSLEIEDPGPDAVNYVLKFR